MTRMTRMARRKAGFRGRARAVRSSRYFPSWMTFQNLLKLRETRPSVSRMARTTLHEYADEVGLYFEDKGLPRIPGRILGWLMVCEPSHQSAEELAEAVQASRGAVSMAMRMLQSANAVERYTVRGTRRVYYRLRPGFWLEEAEEKAKVAREWTKLTGRGLDLLGDRPPEVRRRVQEAHDMYAFLAEEYARIKDRWLERQESRS
jgi:DNA-binding transcriptional regulator GbsR (MarR family)